MNTLFDVLILIGAVTTVLCTGLTVAFGGLDSISFRNAFACQTELWKDTYELNTAGRVILICLATPFVLPTNILFLFAFAVSEAMIGAWKLYKYIFRKREADT